MLAKLVIVALAAVSVPSGGGDSLRVMFWNLENFFDWRDGGGGGSDAEFSSRGERHWTKKKFSAKAAAVAKTILWAGSPPLIGVAEVENASVLRWLCEETPLRKSGYGYVHYDSPDPRGIDVGLLYRKDSVRIQGSRPLRVMATGPPPDGMDTLRTRDILLVSLATGDGQPMEILVNHHPSKYGGGDTDWRREAAVDRLALAIDSLRYGFSGPGGESLIVATGDFNDTPDNPSYRRLEEAGLVNMAAPLWARRLGTIRYDGRWELIDMFFVSESFAGSSRMEILSPPFLSVRDNVHGGEKPLRTYVGPRHEGGVSDHRPVLLTIYFDKK